MFVAGLIARAAIHEAGVRHGMIRTSAIVFGLEILLFGGFAYLQTQAGFAVTNSGTTYLAMTMLALGMSLQNATLTRVGPLSVKTTHATGMLLRLARAFRNSCSGATTARACPSRVECGGSGRSPGGSNPCRRPL